MFFYQAGWFQKLSGFDVNQIFPINKEITVNSTRTFQLTQEGFKNLPEFYLNFQDYVFSSQINSPVALARGIKIFIFRL